MRQLRLMCGATALILAADGCGGAADDAADDGALQTGNTGARSAATAGRASVSATATGAAAAAGTKAASGAAVASAGAGAGPAAAMAGSAGAGSAGSRGVLAGNAGAGAGVSMSASSAAAGSGGSVGGSSTGAAAGGGAGAGSMTGAGAPTLTEVYEKVYAMSCAVCHSMAPSDNSNGTLGMIRSKDQLYDALVNKPTQGTMCSGKGSYVVAGDPDNSVVVQKLSSAPPCGATMPLGGTLQPEQAKLLRDWIAAGALKN